MIRACGTHGKIRNTYKTLVTENLRGGEYLEELGRHEENIKTYLTETGYEEVDWFHLDQNRIQKQTCEYSNETLSSIRREEFKSCQITFVLIFIVSKILLLYMKLKTNYK